MKVNLYAVYDVASGVYDGPIPSQTDAVAIRNFSQMALNGEHTIGKSPKDFSLCVVGRWDDALGEVIPMPVKTLCTALQCISQATRNASGPNGGSNDAT